MAESWLPTLITPDPESGYALAVKLTQPSAEVRTRLRPAYESDADALIAVSSVVAINFQTVAAANNYWRK